MRNHAKRCNFWRDAHLHRRHRQDLDGVGGDPAEEAAPQRRADHRGAGVPAVYGHQRARIEDLLERDRRSVELRDLGSQGLALDCIDANRRKKNGTKYLSEC